VRFGAIELPAAQIEDRALEGAHVGADGAGADGGEFARQPPRLTSGAIAGAEQPRSEEMLQAGDFKLPRMRSSMEHDATALGPRIQMSACAAWATGQLITQAHQRFCRNSRAEARRQSPLRGLLDGDNRHLLCAPPVKLARDIRSER